jgi:hypothetical protein
MSSGRLIVGYLFVQSKPLCVRILINLLEAIERGHAKARRDQLDGFEGIAPEWWSSMRPSRTRSPRPK